MTPAPEPSQKAKSGRKKRQAKTGTTTSEPIDIGTKEFGRQYILKPELISASSGHAVHMRVVDETVCDRLLLRNRITLREHQLTEKLYADLRRANFSKMPCSKMEPSSGGHDPHATMLTDKMVEVGKLFDYLDKSVGQRARVLLTNTILDMRSIDTDTELELFRLGLLAVAVRIERRRKV